jgi:methionine-rich copper-binding protein CopC
MLRARVIALVAIAIISTIALSTPTASAHSQVVSTSPADGAVLEAPPELVSFKFDEPLLPGTVTISINDDQGNVISNVEALVDGPTVSAPWPAGAKSGTFRGLRGRPSGDRRDHHDDRGSVSAANPIASDTIDRDTIDRAHGQPEQCGRN